MYRNWYFKCHHRIQNLIKLSKNNDQPAIFNSQHNPRGMTEHGFTGSIKNNFANILMILLNRLLCLKRRLATINNRLRDRFLPAASPQRRFLESLHARPDSRFFQRCTLYTFLQLNHEETLRSLLQWWYLRQSGTRS